MDYEELLYDLLDEKGPITTEYMENYNVHPYNVTKTILAALCYIAWKVEEIDRKTKDKGEIP